MQKYKVSDFSEESQENKLYILAEFFKMLGNPVRIHLLLLLKEYEVSVNELAVKIGYTQSATSHQLNLLKANDLVRKHRKGKMIFYSLANDDVLAIIEEAEKYIFTYSNEHR